MCIRDSVTTDGSISDIPWEEYEEAEERVIDELKEINKPFVVLLNCVNPESESARQLAAQLREKYAVPVVAVSCMELSEDEIRKILALILFEFPVKEISVDIPQWVMEMEKDHWLRQSRCV